MAGQTMTRVTATTLFLASEATATAIAAEIIATRATVAYVRKASPDIGWNASAALPPSAQKAARPPLPFELKQQRGVGQACPTKEVAREVGPLTRARDVPGSLDCRSDPPQVVLRELQRPGRPATTRVMDERLQDSTDAVADRDVHCLIQVDGGHPVREGAETLGGPGIAGQHLGADHHQTRSAAAPSGGDVDGRPENLLEPIDRARDPLLVPEPG